jgi:mannose-6-phosphate isomerase-like protein (cupin superfamily)
MRKAQEDFNLRKHAQYDVKNIEEYVKNFTNEWLIDTKRQEMSNIHKETNTYYVYKNNLMWKIGEEFVTKQISDDKVLLELLEPIISDLERIHDGVRANVLLIKLTAKENIPIHEDGGDYLMLSRRNHIPIITSGDVVFGVGSERVNMQPGECWEINNYRLHWVDNNSDIDRVHLLIDIMPNEEIGKK